MANYRKITDVEVLAEASESTNVLVEENGSLKKMAMANMGGGNGSVAFIRNSDSGYIEGGMYDFINIDDYSVIEQATNDKVEQALKNGIVYVVNSDESMPFHEMSPIIHYVNYDGYREYMAYAFGGSSVYLATFDIWDDK